MKSSWKIQIADLKSNSKQLNVWSRSKKIAPEHINTTVGIYNGKKILNRKITTAMIGLSFGELVPTRILPKHPTKANRKGVS